MNSSTTGTGTIGSNNNSKRIIYSSTSNNNKIYNKTTTNRNRTNSVTTKNEMAVVEKALSNLVSLKDALKRMEQQQQQQQRIYRSKSNQRNSTPYYNNSDTYEGDDKLDNDDQDRDKRQQQQQEQDIHRRPLDQPKTTTTTPRGTRRQTERRGPSQDPMDRIRSFSRSRLLNITSSGGTSDIDPFLQQQDRQQSRDDLQRLRSRSRTRRHHEPRSPSPTRRQHQHQHQHQQHLGQRLPTNPSYTFDGAGDARQSWYNSTRRDVDDARYEIHQVTKSEHNNIGQGQEMELGLYHQPTDVVPRPISNNTLHPMQKAVLVDLFSEDSEHVSATLESILTYCSLETNNSDVEVNRSLISDVGGHYIILSILKKWYAYVYVQSNACIALHYLAVNKRVRENLNQLDTIDTIVRIMKNYPYDNRIQQYTCGIINSLTWKNEESTCRFCVDNDGPNTVIAAMKQFGTNTVLQQFGTLIIVNMIRWDKFRSIVIHSGGRERLTKVIMDYTEQQSKKSISTLGNNDDSNKDQAQLPMIDFDYKIYKKARKAIRRLL